MPYHAEPLLGTAYSGPGVRGMTEQELQALLSFQKKKKEKKSLWKCHHNVCSSRHIQKRTHQKPVCRSITEGLV